MSPNTWSRIRTITLVVVLLGGSFAWWAHIARQKAEVKAKQAEAKAQEELNKRYPVKGRYVDMGDGPRDAFKSPAQRPDSFDAPGMPEREKPSVEPERRRMRIGRAEE